MADIQKIGKRRLKEGVRVFGMVAIIVSIIFFCFGILGAWLSPDKISYYDVNSLHEGFVEVVLVMLFVPAGLWVLADYVHVVGKIQDKDF
jgi:Kef-type K+ transport system membrane component KefB